MVFQIAQTLIRRPIALNSANPARGVLSRKRITKFNASKYSSAIVIVNVVGMKLSSQSSV